MDIKEIKSKILKNSKAIGISSDEVVLAKSLVDNKNKDDSLFICEGLWAVEKLIERKFKVLHFFFNSEFLDKNNNEEEFLKILKICEYSANSYSISAKTCKKISDREGFDEFFIIAQMPKYSLDDLENFISGKNNLLAMVMDGLEQPGNIGAILRSFDCAGGDFAIITNRQAKLNNSRLIRSSLGASFMMPVLEASIQDVQNWLVKNNFKVVVTDLQSSKNYREMDYSGRVAIVAGNEHKGISDSWRHIKNSHSIIIPMLGSCESLNVGFASTLVAYEAGLQKFGDKKNK